MHGCTVFLINPLKTGAFAKSVFCFGASFRQCHIGLKKQRWFLQMAMWHLSHFKFEWLQLVGT